MSGSTWRNRVKCRHVLSGGWIIFMTFSSSCSSSKEAPTRHTSTDKRRIIGNTHTQQCTIKKKRQNILCYISTTIMFPPPIDRPSTATNNNEKVVPCYVGFETREQENRKKRRDNWFASFSFCRYLNAFEIHAPERNYGQRGKRRRRGGCSLLLWLLFCWHCLWFREHGWNIEKKKKGMLHFETLPTIV